MNFPENQNLSVFGGELPQGVLNLLAEFAAFGGVLRRRGRVRNLYAGLLGVERRPGVRVAALSAAQ